MEQDDAQVPELVRDRGPVSHSGTDRLAASVKHIRDGAEAREQRGGRQVRLVAGRAEQGR